MSGPLVFHSRRGIRIKLDAEVVTQLYAYRQEGQDDLEAGGVLLGRHLLGSGDIVVDDTTVPMPGDERSRFHFRRDCKWHQRHIDNAWRSSGGTCGYLGEWHTHPEEIPTPSSVDLRDWRRRLRRDRFDGQMLYFAIVGIVELRMWEGRRHDGAMSLLARLEQGS